MADILRDSQESIEDTLKGRFLTFSIDRETYGIEIKYVTEIIGMQAVTKLPEMPEYMKGIINLRGKVIPVMDIRLRFKKDPTEYNNRTCVIVVDINNKSVGLIVDTVAEVLTINEDNIVDPPQMNMGTSRYISKIGKIENDVKLLLDCEKLLSGEELKKLSIVL